MNESYFVSWINKDGINQVPVLAENCHSFEQAARWAIEWNFPVWATNKTQFIVYQGQPNKFANQARFRVGLVPIASRE
jgi:hypothetical protein